MRRAVEAALPLLQRRLEEPEHILVLARLEQLARLAAVREELEVPQLHDLSYTCPEVEHQVLHRVALLVRHRLEGKPLAVLRGAGPCAELHGRRLDAADALLVQLVGRGPADEGLAALVDLGQHGGQAQAAAGLGHVDDEEVLEVVLAAEVGFDGGVGEVLVRLLELDFARLVEDSDLEAERHGVAEEHPAHAVAAPAGLQPAVDALVAYTLVHVCLGALLMIEIVREDQFVIIVTGREVQGAWVPFGQQHQTLDGAQCAETFARQRVHV